MPAQLPIAWKLFIPIMRQQLRHFEQNLNLKSILQETSDNVTLESRAWIVTRIDYFFEEREKKNRYVIISYIPNSNISGFWMELEFQKMFAIQKLCRTLKKHQNWTKIKDGNEMKKNLVQFFLQQPNSQFFSFG